MKKLLPICIMLLATVGFKIVEEEMGNAATEEMIRSANAGKADSQFELGKCYYYGNGVETNFIEAAKWFLKAAEQGHAEAQFDIGTMYADGKGIDKNWTEAEKWFIKSANQDFTKAQVNLCTMYAEGIGVAKNSAVAEKWFNKLSDKNDGLVNLDRWVYYSLYNSTRHTYRKSAEWLQKRAEKGRAEAQYILARRYANGDGVVTNYVEAVKWYKVAAEQYSDKVSALCGSAIHLEPTADGDRKLVGTTTALERILSFTRNLLRDEEADRLSDELLAHKHPARAIGDIYSMGGWGIRKDDAESAIWYRKAAESGDRYSMLTLGDMYFYGRGVEKDAMEAVRWYLLATEGCPILNHSRNEESHKYRIYYRLAGCYWRGEGVNKNVFTAAKWWLKWFDESGFGIVVVVGGIAVLFTIWLTIIIIKNIVEKFTRKRGR